MCLKIFFCTAKTASLLCVAIYHTWLSNVGKALPASSWAHALCPKTRLAEQFWTLQNSPDIDLGELMIYTIEFAILRNPLQSILYYNQIGFQVSTCQVYRCIFLGHQICTIATVVTLRQRIQWPWSLSVRILVGFHSCWTVYPTTPCFIFPLKFENDLLLETYEESTAWWNFQHSMNDIMFSGMYHIDILYIYKHVSHAIAAIYAGFIYLITGSPQNHKTRIGLGESLSV